jgi:hydrogenase nickel incorporation protein HypA/HybF
VHELGVTQSILHIALHHAQEAGAVRVKEVNLVIGELSSIVDDSVQFYWEQLSHNTLAEGSQLHFRRIPTELLCLSCDRRYTPARDDFACPSCGGMRIKVVAGEEFYLESIEVE